MGIYNGTGRYVVYMGGNRYVDSLTRPKLPNWSGLTVTDWTYSKSVTLGTSLTVSFTIDTDRPALWGNFLAYGITSGCEKGRSITTLSSYSEVFYNVASAPNFYYKNASVSGYWDADLNTCGITATVKGDRITVPAETYIRQFSVPDTSPVQWKCYATFINNFGIGIDAIVGVYNKVLDKVLVSKVVSIPVGTTNIDIGVYSNNIAYPLLTIKIWDATINNNDF